MSDDTKPKLSITALLSFALKGGGAVLGLAFQLFLARTMSTEQFGIFTIAFTATITAVTFASMGLPFAATKFVPAYLAAGDYGKARGFFRGGLVASWLGSVLIAALAGLSFYWARSSLGQDLYLSLLLGAACLPLLTALQTQVAFLQSLQRIGTAELLANILRPLFTIVGGAVLIMLGFATALSAVQAMLISLLAIALSAMIAYQRFYSLRPATLVEAPPQSDYRNWVKAGLAMLLIISGVLLNERMDVLLIGYFLGPEQAGIYGVAARLSFIIGFALAAVNSLLGPMLSELSATAGKEKLRQTAVFGACLAFAAAATIGLLLLLFGEFILGLFGDDFIAARPALVFLVAAQVAVAAFGATGAVAILYNGYKVTLFAVLFGLAINLALNILLIPLYGALGSAVATFAALTLSHIVVLWWCQQHTGINPSIFGLLQGGLSGAKHER